MLTRSSRSKSNEKSNSVDEIVSEPAAVVEGSIITSENQPIVVEEEATAVLSCSSNPENFSVPALIGNKRKKVYRKISK